jgi:hypothetical protein
MIVIVQWVLAVAPLGVFALAMGVGLRAGLGAAGVLGHYIALVVLSLIGLILLTYGIATVFGRISLSRFASAVAPAQVVAFSTQSSLACLPVMVERATTRLGVSAPTAGLVLPLAVACPATEFEKLWDWAHAKTGGDIDRQLSGIAATYALPVVPSIDAPRDAGSSAGPLLDPRDLGIDVGEIVSLPVRHATPSRMLGDPDKEYVVHETGEAIYVYDDLDEDEVWSLDRERASMVHEPTLLSPAPSLAATIVRHDSRFPIAAPRPRRRRKTLVVDFDGVLHSYVSGWKGPTSVPDAPVEGALQFLESAVERFEVAVLSSRSREAGGIDAMKDWLREHGLSERVLGQLRFPRTKPPAHVYLDDRGWRFEGTFPTLDAIDAFEPWHKREPHEAEPDDP